MRSRAAPRPRSLAGRIVASLGVLAAGGAVVGLGTVGTFTDSTTSVGTAIDGGVVSIDLSAPSRLGTVPLAFDGVLPGASTSRTVSIVNDGSSELASVTMTAVATVSSVLDTDRSRGLQLSVRSCSVPWSPGVGCAGTQRTLLPSGPVIREAALDRPASLAPGGTDHLALTVSLPDTAGNEFAGRSSALQFTFTAAQRPGTAR